MFLDSRPSHTGSAESDVDAQITRLQALMNASVEREEFEKCAGLCRICVIVQDNVY